MDDYILCTLSDRGHEADIELSHVLILAVILTVIAHVPGLHLFSGQHAELSDQVAVDLLCVWDNEEVIPVFYFSPFLH